MTPVSPHIFFTIDKKFLTPIIHSLYHLSGHNPTTRNPSHNFRAYDSLVTSACLGLTCKAFCSIHRSQYGTVHLRSTMSFEPDGQDFTNLGLLLKDCFLRPLPTTTDRESLSSAQRWLDFGSSGSKEKKISSSCSLG
jgi:hypothetical protein